MLGRIEKYLLEKIKADGSIHITLIDPEKVLLLKPHGLLKVPKTAEQLP